MEDKNAHIAISKSQRNRTLGRYRCVRENFSVFLITLAQVKGQYRRTLGSIRRELFLYQMNHWRLFNKVYTSWCYVVVMVLVCIMGTCHGVFCCASFHVHAAAIWEFRSSGVWCLGVDVVSETSRVDRLHWNVENGLTIDAMSQPRIGFSYFDS